MIKLLPFLLAAAIGVASTSTGRTQDATTETFAPPATSNNNAGEAETFKEAAPQSEGSKAEAETGTSFKATTRWLCQIKGKYIVCFGEFYNELSKEAH